MKTQALTALVLASAINLAHASCNDLNTSNYAAVRALMVTARTSAQVAHNEAAPSNTSTIYLAAYQPMIDALDVFVGYAANTPDASKGPYAAQIFGLSINNYLNGLRYWTTINVFYNRATFNRPAALAAAKTALLDINAVGAAVENMHMKAQACVLSIQ